MIIRCIVIDKVYSNLFQLHEWIERLPMVSILEMFNNRASAEEFLKTNEVDLILTHSEKDDLSWIRRMRSRFGSFFAIIMKVMKTRCRGRRNP